MGNYSDKTRPPMSDAEAAGRPGAPAPALVEAVRVVLRMGPMTADRIESVHTPSTGQVRVNYQHDRVLDGVYAPESGAEFDRWLAQVVAEAEARGAREALLSAADDARWDRAEHRHVRDWLRARAEQAEVSRG